MTVHRSSYALRRRLAPWAVLPLVALGAACGGQQDDGGDPAGSSAETSEPAGSDAQLDVDTIVPAMQSAVEEATSARVQVELTGQVEMAMDGRMAMAEKAEDGAMELTVEVGGQRLELRQVDGLIYLSGPPATPQGKWLEVDPQDPDDPFAQQFSALTETTDLTSTLDAFEAGLEEVEYVGEEEIDGQQTDHYVFTVDAAKAAEGSGQSMPSAPEDLSYDVWLTEDDLIRRVSFELQANELVLDATEWGEPVDVEAPAQSDIIDGPPTG